MTAGLTTSVQLWWPTPVLRRTFHGAHGSPEFRDWLAKAARDLAGDLARPGETVPELVLATADCAIAPTGLVPRRASGALFAGIYCIDPGPGAAAKLVFLDPRTSADMIPGTSAPEQAVRELGLAARQLALFPGWLAQGYTAAAGPAAPRWLLVRFRPQAFSGLPIS
jgi:hypothetical protein